MAARPSEAERFEIVWDGSHRGCDADLLGCPPQVEKAQPPATKREGGTSEQVRAAVEAVLGATPLQTMKELATAIGVTTSRVNEALYALRQRGRVESVDGGARRQFGGTQQRYRLIDGVGSIREHGEKEGHAYSDHQ